MWPTAKAALSHRADHSRQSATAVWPHSIFSSALTIVFDVAHTYARFCQEFFFLSFLTLCLPIKRKLLFHFSFILFSSFSVTKSHTSCLHSDLFVCFQILVPHGWFLNVQRADIYACANGCVRLHDCTSASARARAFMRLLLLLLWGCLVKWAVWYSALLLDTVACWMH